MFRDSGYDSIMRFNYTISHVPGKELSTADALSHAPVSEPSLRDQEFQEEVRAFLEVIVQGVPATEKHSIEIQCTQRRDPVCQTLIQKGWPPRHFLLGYLKPYYPTRDEISVHDGLLFQGSRIIIPNNLHQDVLTKLHSGH